MFGRQITTFIVMWLVGIVLNPMNFLAFSWRHLYFSKTLAYIGLLMAANMTWIHELIHYAYGGCGKMECATTFMIGFTLSCVAVYLMRNQVWIYPKDWMRRMIPHHSTALTTTTQLVKNNILSDDQQKLAKDILEVQKEEIAEMKRMLGEK